MNDHLLLPAEQAAIADEIDAEDLQVLARLAGDEPAPVPANVQTPVYEAALPDDFSHQAQGIAEREAELARQFRAGELEFDDFEDQRSALLAEREALTIARAKAEISHEMSSQAAQRQWQGAVNSFLRGAAAEVDYRGDAEAMADLDSFVKMLANDPRHSARPMEWFLTEAHRRVLAMRLEVADDPRGSRGQEPGADLDRVLDLDGLEYEQAIARMTPAQRERFARG